jgi:hypothetical protein
MFSSMPSTRPPSAVHCTIFLGSSRSGPQIMSLIAGTMQFLAHQDYRSPMCPSCNGCVESCSDVARCQEKGGTLAFEQSAQMMEQWPKKNNTHPDLLHTLLLSLLLWYLHSRSSTTCSKCSKELNLPHIIQEFAASQDHIGWDGLIMGMVSSNSSLSKAHTSSNAIPPISIRQHAGYQE